MIYVNLLDNRKVQIQSLTCKIYHWPVRSLPSYLIACDPLSRDGDRHRKSILLRLIVKLWLKINRYIFFVKSWYGKRLAERAGNISHVIWKAVYKSEKGLKNLTQKEKKTVNPRHCFCLLIKTRLMFQKMILWMQKGVYWMPTPQLECNWFKHSSSGIFRNFLFSIVWSGEI